MPSAAHLPDASSFRAERQVLSTYRDAIIGAGDASRFAAKFVVSDEYVQLYAGSPRRFLAKLYGELQS